MFDKTVKELGNALRRKEFSSVELTQAFLDRSKSLNGKINAFITFDEEQTLAQARAAY